MNPQTAALVVESVGAVQHLLASGLDGAVVVHEGDERFWLVEVDYWDSAAASLNFEQTAAEEARQRGSQRAVLAVPMVCRDIDGVFAYRPPTDGPLEAGETEEVFALSVDLADGMDVHHCVFTRSEDTLTFGTVMTHEINFKLAESSPGSRMLGALVKPS